MSDDRGHCPKCGRFCGNIIGVSELHEQGPYLATVTGVCKVHGKQDLSKQGWAWEDFWP